MLRFRLLPLLLAITIGVLFSAPAGASAAGLKVTVTDRPTTYVTATAETFAWTTRQGRSIARGVTTTCVLDGEALRGSCSSPRRITGLRAGRHTLVIRSTKRAGRRTLSGTATVRWTIDTKAPARPTISGSTGAWSLAPVTATAISTDVLSGIDHYESDISTDGGTTFRGRANGAVRTVTTPGAHVVRFRAVDRAGNAGAYARVDVRVDDAAPLVPTVSGGLSSWTGVATRAVTATSSDATSGIARLEFQTSVDGGATWSVLSSGPSVSLSQEGTTVVRFRAIDNAGRASAFSTPDAAATVRLDRTAPDVPIVAGGNSTWQPGGAIVIFAEGSSDAASGFLGYERRSSSDGVTWTEPVAGNLVSITAEGTTFVQYRGVDAVGNRSAWTPVAGSAAGTARIDRTSPTAPTTVSGGSNLWRNTVPVIIEGVGAGDSFSSFTYETRTSNDGGSSWVTIAGARATVTAEGTTVVQVRAIDAAGNSSDWAPSIAGASNTAKIDTVAPTAPTTVLGGHTAWSAFGSKTLTASGAGDLTSAFTYEYRTALNGAAFGADGTAGFSVVVADEGETLVQFRARDAAQNVSGWTASEMVRLDRTGPNTPTVLGGVAGFQDLPSVTITASASFDAKNGPATYEYRTSTDGTNFNTATAGSFVEISAEGTTYVQFRSLDSLNNESAWAPAVNGTDNTVRLDRVDPTAPTTIGGSASTWNKTAVTITASGSVDNGSGFHHHTFETSVNQTDWTAPVTGDSVTFATEGVHYVRFRAYDGVNRVSGYSATATAKLDLTLPTAPVVSGGSLSYANSHSQSIIAGGSSDAGGSSLADYQYREIINAGLPSEPINGAVDLVVREGKTVVQFRSTDAAGNFSAWTPALPDATNTVLLDRSVPSVPIVTGGSDTYQAGPVTIFGSGSSDLYSGPVSYEYRLSTDGGASYGASFPGASAVVSAPGVTNVQFHAKDAIGNTTNWFPATPNADSTVKIDNVPPTVPTVTGGSDSWSTDGSTVFTASSTDTLSEPVTYNVRTSTNGATWSSPGVAAPGGIATVTAEGQRYVQFEAVDASNNRSAWGPDPVIADSTSRLDRSAPVAPTLHGGSSTWFDASSRPITTSGGSDTVSSILRLEYRTKVNSAEYSVVTTGIAVSPAAEGTTLVEFRSVDLAGNFSSWAGGVAGTVMLDRTAPTAPTLTGTSSAWRPTKPATIGAAGSDTLSGVAGYQVSTDAGFSWGSPVLNGSFAFNDEGTTDALYRTVDNVGRFSATTADTVTIDTVAPDAPTGIDGSLTWQKADKTLTVSGGDGTGSTLSYRYQTSNDDGGTWTGTSGTGTSHTFTTDGRHRIRFYSVDQAGHESPAYAGTATSNAAYIDNAGPTGGSTSGGSDLFFNTDRTASVNGATDALEGTVTYALELSTNGSAFVAQADANTITLTADGEYLVRFTAKDALGNLGTPFDPIEVNIDKTLPSIPASLVGGNLTWSKLRTTATFVGAGATDSNGGTDAVTYEYELTRGVTVTEGANPVVTAQGEVSARARAKDRAGNVSAYISGTAGSDIIRIDTVAPTVPTVSGGSTTWQGTAPHVITAAGSSDATPGVLTSNGVTYTSQVNTNGAGFGDAVLSSATRSVSAEGITIVRFRAEDAAGNASEFTTHVGNDDNQVKIDTIAPTVPSVTGGSADWIAGPTQAIAASTLGTDVAPGSGVKRTEFETTTDLSGGGGWAGPTSGASVTFETTGERIVRFRTVDNANNESAWSPATPTAASQSHLDVTAPVAPVALGGSNTFQNAGSVTVSAAATTDVGSGVDSYWYQTSLNGGAWSGYEEGSFVSVVAEGTTLVRFRAVDNVGNESLDSADGASATVRIDRTAPTNPTAAGGSYAWQKVGSVNVAPAASTDINASNLSAGSGIESYEYRTSTNGGSTFSGPTPLAVGGHVTIANEADTIIQFRATDYVGFTSAWSPSPPIAASTVRLDRTPPTAPTITGGANTFVHANSRTVSASASDGGLSAGVTYKYRTSLNAGAWVEGLGSSVTVGDEGTTLVEFMSIDGALNESAWTSAGANSTVMLDRSAPTVPTLSGDTGLSFRPLSGSPVVVTGASTDTNGVGGITYQSQVSLNGGTFGDVLTGATRSISEEGVTIVQFRASDSLGHWSAWSPEAGSAINTVALDKTAPSVPTITGGSTFWRDDASVLVSLAVSTDTGGSSLSRREYQTTNNSITSGWIEYVAPFTVTAEGPTTIVSRAVDMAGNISSTDTAQVKLDRLSPTDATVTGGNGGACLASGSVTIAGSGSSDGVGSGISFYEYRVSTNGGTFTTATTGPSVTIPYLAATTYVVQFRATDAGGHASAWAPFAANSANTACFS